MVSSRADTARVRKIITTLRRGYPDAKLALNFGSPLQLLVALILAAQCTDAKVNEVTQILFRRFRTPRDYATVVPDALESAIRSTGFYRQKAKAIRGCCQQLLDRFDGMVPKDLNALLTLPGVGRKTANILLGNAFGVPAIGVDTHVARLSQRLGLTRQKEPDKIEIDLTRLVAQDEQTAFCHLLQCHGRRVCIAWKPSCHDCQIAAFCPYPQKTTVIKSTTRSRRSK